MGKPGNDQHRTSAVTWKCCGCSRWYQGYSNRAAATGESILENKVVLRDVREAER